MHARTLAGYREIEHTADWELELWAPDLAGLLEQAAQGMYALAGIRLADGPRCQQTLEIQASDAESLLVSFLSELLYLSEQGLAFDVFTLTLQQPSAGGWQLQASLEGAPLAAISKEIKAVTYHRLAIRQTQDGLAANLVLDV